MKTGVPECTVKVSRIQIKKKKKNPHGEITTHILNYHAVTYGRSVNIESQHPSVS